MGVVSVVCAVALFVVWFCFFFASRRRHTRCALVTGVQTCALPILGRILAGLAPREPEVHGLLALMELQASRSKARVAPNGEPVLLLEQDRAHWDRLLIRRGLAALERAEALGGADGDRQSVVSGRSGSVRLDIGGRRIIKKKK